MYDKIELFTYIICINNLSPTLFHFRFYL